MKQKLILLFSTVLIIFLLSELLFSFFTKVDLDGNKQIGYVHLYPFHLPIKETEKKINALQKHLVSDSLKNNYKNNFVRKYFNVRLIPDSILGWSPNPYFKSKDDLYIYNKSGIRSESILKEYDNKKGLRIGIFGDSYSHGDEVAFQNTIGYYLQNKLDSASLNTEVINFAVSGYGVDQAFLRWKEVQNSFSLDVVILGVQFENAKRNVNLLRPFYYFTTEIPYSKPRFVLAGNKLQLIKNPITKTDEIYKTIANFPQWDFSKFEYFYNPDNYKNKFFLYSRTISFIVSAITQMFDEINYYTPQNESYQVTYKLINKFKYDVEGKGKVFIPVHLPVKNDFDFLTGEFIAIFYSQKFIYDQLFEALKLKMNFVETYQALQNYGENENTNKLFMKRHYSPVANKIIANRIFNFIVKKTALTN